MELQKMKSESDHVHGVPGGPAAAVGGTVPEESQAAAGEVLEHRFSLGAIVRDASARIKSFSRDVRSFASSRSAHSSRYEVASTAALHALVGLKFIRQTDGEAAGWLKVEKSFHRLTASPDRSLHRCSFAECIGMGKESTEFGGRLFDALARRHEIKGDSIDKNQLKMFWDQITDESFHSRLQTFFDMVDKDADGKITEEEVKEIINLSASTNHLCNIESQADEYAALIMEALDPKNEGYIPVEKLEMVLLEASKKSARGEDSKRLSQLLSGQLRVPENPVMRWCHGIKCFIRHNWRRMWILALWVGVMMGLFAYKYVQYRNKPAYQVVGYCVCMAKGAAETLKLNMALILLPVCRNTMTWLRNKTKLGIVVPFDDNLNFHMVVGVGIAVGTAIHVIFHMACDFPRLIHASSEKFALLEAYFKEQPTSYWEFVKGVEGVSGILMVVLMVIAFTLATPWLRRSKLTGFNTFWYTHHLFVIVYALLVVHGIYLYLSKTWYQKTTWMYLAVPVVLYALERFTRAFRSSIETVKIEKAYDYAGRKGVLALHMKKPDDFQYRSGQYMFLNCPDVSPFEWHPFSITSAPGDKYLSVYIQAIGDWTGQMYKIFSEANKVARKCDLSEGENQPIYPKVLIDGPYGAPAQDYKNYEVVMLVGLGIGATPMISIVKDILHNIEEMEKGGGGDIEEGGGGEEDEKEFKTRRAYFYWMAKEQDSFEWFKGVMDEVAELDRDGVIELHNHCTSVHADARSAFISMIQDLNHAKKGVDIVSGTRVKAQFSKPTWRKVYKYIARKHPHTEVGVFYCGPPGPIKELRELALDFTEKTSTTFDFHKENF